MTVSPAPPKELLFAVPRGAVSSVSFAEFYALQWSDLAGYSAALVGSVLVGDEIAQEAFVRLYARYPLIREPRPYVFRIASNLARRHRGTAVEAPLEWAPEGVVPTATTGVQAELLDAVRRLPLRLRAVVLLHYYVDLPVDEVAHVLRRPAGSVKRQLAEARSALAVALTDIPGGSA